MKNVKAEKKLKKEKSFGFWIKIPRYAVVKDDEVENIFGERKF
jgi:hypothetical protein